MAIFNVVPVESDNVAGWVVKTTHDDGVIETSIVYASIEKAQEAAKSWSDLDEDWARI